MRGSNAESCPLRLPAYQPIPAPDRGTDLIEVSAAQLQPTQWCVGLAEIWSREKDFAQDTRQQRLDYLRGKPVPLIRSADGAMWMLDRHHRLRGLIGIDPGATTWAYVVEDLVPTEALCWASCTWNRFGLELYLYRSAAGVLQPRLALPLRRTRQRPAPGRAAAHEPAGTGRRSLPEPRVEAEAGGMDQASAPDPVSRVSLGCLAAQPAPAPLQLQALGAQH